MQIKNLVLVGLLAIPTFVWAQDPPPPPAPRGGMVAGTKVMTFHTGMMGKWWQNSETVKKLQLTDAQISQLDQIFYEHRMKLIDFGADMEKQDLKLQTLLDADVPDEGQINSQVDQVLESRGKLERESTIMNLDLRKVLSLAQWRQLKLMRGPAGGFGDRIFFQKMVPPGGATLQVAPLPPGATPFTLPAPPPDDL